MCIRDRVPTTLARPEITGTGIWDQMLNLVYTVDPSANLFPSIHCLVSWFCYVGIRGQKKVPLWYQRFSCVFAVLVCISTQVTKQHYIIDLIGGILLGKNRRRTAGEGTVCTDYGCILERKPSA